MTKLQFLLSLHDKLKGLPNNEVEERLNFYSEMIEDRMEEGLSEEEAVAAIGTVEEIAEQILLEIPLAKIVKEKVRPKGRMKTWVIVLLAAGSPVWLSLLIAGFSVVLSVYICLWSLLISFWAVFVSLGISSLALALVGIVFVIGGHTAAGLCMFAGALVCAGFSILTFFGCKAVSRGSIVLTKKMALAVRRCFVRKEEGK